MYNHTSDVEQAKAQDVRRTEKKVLRQVVPVAKTVFAPVGERSIPLSHYVFANLK